MTIEELKALDSDPKAFVEELKKGRTKTMPDLKEIQKSIEVTKHNIFDIALRADKAIKDDEGNTRIEKVARIGLALQKLIVKRAVAFLFGNPVKYTNVQDVSEKSEDDAFTAFKEIIKSAKLNSFNRKVARDLFTATEVAELWYPVPISTEEKAASKDVKGKYKLKVKKFSVLDGDKLYPYFDQYGSMIAFGREYIVGDKTFIDVFTDEKINKINITTDPVVVEGFPKPNVIGKIPIVFATQETSACHDVEGLIERLEKLLSNFADTNDYHAAPKLFVQGEIKGFSKKGESGTIIEGEENAKVEYLSWNNAPEAVRTEIATLKEMIFMITQTPDISFESLKGKGGTATSGKALKFMFLDAHLKVMDNMEVFDEYLMRRNSIIKAFMGVVRTDMKEKVKALKIEIEVIPYMFDDTADRLEFVMTANGNRPVISRKTAVSMAGLSEDAEAEISEIEKEEKADVFEPTGL